MPRLDKPSHVLDARTRKWNINGERWAAMPGWERFANVSELGRVFITARDVPVNRNQGGSPTRMIGGRHRATHLLKGYLIVRMGLRGKLSDVFIHKVVALAFVPNPAGHKYVIHKDGNIRNNRADNLVWGNRRDKEAAYRKRIGTPHPNAGSNQENVVARVREVRRLLATGLTGKQVAAQLGMSMQNVSQIKNGLRHSTIGHDY